MTAEMDRQSDATFGQPYPPRRGTRWSIVVALLIVAGLGVWFALEWPSRQESASAVDPEAHGRAVGTGGERIPGATGAPLASNELDKKPFPMPTSWDRATAIAYMDRQPLYLVGSQPETIPDANMMMEGTTEEGKVNGGYYLYVPKDSASTSAARDDVSARYYYLRIGPNQYVKISHKLANP